MFLFKISYDGTGFYGSAIQPGKRTVQGELVEFCRTTGLGDYSSGSIQFSSRTDRGVSALGNVVKIAAEEPLKFAKAVNASFNDLKITAYAPSPPQFNVRNATSRTYRYFFDGLLQDPLLAKNTLSLFKGTHDFSCFSRVEKHRSPLRCVDEISLEMWSFSVVGTSYHSSDISSTFEHNMASCTPRSCDGYYREKTETGCETEMVQSPHIYQKTICIHALKIKGKSFLWNMVRRIAGSVLMVQAGKIRLEEIQSALKTEGIPSSPTNEHNRDVSPGNPHLFFCAPPEGLFLWDVDYKNISFVNLYKPQSSTDIMAGTPNSGKAMYRNTHTENLLNALRRNILLF